jgi:aquaporin Z
LRTAKNWSSAEFIGTFWLVLGGCGSAVLAASFPEVGIGLTGVSLAFGLTVLTAAYSLGPISGGHFNPAVTLGLWAGGRFPAKQIGPYMLIQVAGAIAAAASCMRSPAASPASTPRPVSPPTAMASIRRAAMRSARPSSREVVMTFMFVLVILGATHTRAPVGFAGLAIGLALTLIHLISIPVTNTSVNPARSTGPALFAGGWALGQLWLFWLAPLLGGRWPGSCTAACCSANRPSRWSAAGPSRA